MKFVNFHNISFKNCNFYKTEIIDGKIKNLIFSKNEFLESEIKNMEM